MLAVFRIGATIDDETLQGFFQRLAINLNGDSVANPGTYPKSRATLKLKLHPAQTIALFQPIGLVPDRLC